MEQIYKYLLVGGMPEAVSTYAKNHSLKDVRRVHLRLLSDYEQDFSKHAPREIIPRIRRQSFLVFLFFPILLLKSFPDTYLNSIP